MKKQFVTYKIALKLKELGFNEKCDAIYNPMFLIDGCWQTTNTYIKNFPKTEEGVCAAPLWQQAIDWLREKHQIHIQITSASNIREEIGYKYHTRAANKLYDSGINFNSKIGLIFSYREARKRAILKALELIS